MKIIFLNTWNGKIRDAIAGFIREQSADTDVFCLQEVYEKMGTLCDELLPGYKKFSGRKRISEENDFSQSTYVRDNLKISSSDLVLEKQEGAGLGMYTEIETEHGSFHLCNFHGWAWPGDKLDTPGRISQSQGLIDFFEDKTGPKIIGGDFNLMPDGESIAMFGREGYKDLIKSFNIRTTRNRLAWAMYPGNEQYYSDYVFASTDVNVEAFSVPKNEIADHLPMILSITIKNGHR